MNRSQATAGNSGTSPCCLFCENKPTRSDTHSAKLLEKATQKIFNSLLIPNDSFSDVLQAQGLSFCPSCLSIVSEVVEIQKKIEVCELLIKSKVETVGKLVRDSPHQGTSIYTSARQKKAVVWVKFHQPVIQNYADGRLPNPCVRLKAENYDDLTPDLDLPVTQSQSSASKRSQTRIKKATSKVARKSTAQGQKRTRGAEGNNGIVVKLGVSLVKAKNLKKVTASKDSTKNAKDSDVKSLDVDLSSQSGDSDGEVADNNNITIKNTKKIVRSPLHEVSVVVKRHTRIKSPLIKPKPNLSPKRQRRGQLNHAPSSHSKNESEEDQTSNQTTGLRNKKVLRKQNKANENKEDDSGRTLNVDNIKRESPDMFSDDGENGENNDDDEEDELFAKLVNVKTSNTPNSTKGKIRRRKRESSGRSDESDEDTKKRKLTPKKVDKKRKESASTSPVPVTRTRTKRVQQKKTSEEPSDSVSDENLFTAVKVPKSKVKALLAKSPPKPKAKAEEEDEKSNSSDTFTMLPPDEVPTVEGDSNSESEEDDDALPKEDEMEDSLVTVESWLRLVTIPTNPEEYQRELEDKELQEAEEKDLHKYLETDSDGVLKCRFCGYTGDEDGEWTQNMKEVVLLAHVKEVHFEDVKPDVKEIADLPEPDVQEDNSNTEDNSMPPIIKSVQSLSQNTAKTPTTTKTYPKINALPQAPIKAGRFHCPQCDFSVAIMLTEANKKLSEAITQASFKLRSHYSLFHMVVKCNQVSSSKHHPQKGFQCQKCSYFCPVPSVYNSPNATKTSADRAKYYGAHRALANHYLEIHEGFKFEISPTCDTPKVPNVPKVSTAPENPSNSTPTTIDYQYNGRHYFSCPHNPCTFVIIRPNHELTAETDQFSSSNSIFSSMAQHYSQVHLEDKQLTKLGTGIFAQDGFKCDSQNCSFFSRIQVPLAQELQEFSQSQQGLYPKLKAQLILAKHCLKEHHRFSGTHRVKYLKNILVTLTPEEEKSLGRKLASKPPPLLPTLPENPSNPAISLPIPPPIKDQEPITLLQCTSCKFVVQVDQAKQNSLIGRRSQPHSALFLAKCRLTRHYNRIHNTQELKHGRPKELIITEGGKDHFKCPREGCDYIREVKYDGKDPYVTRNNTRLRLYDHFNMFHNPKMFTKILRPLSDLKKLLLESELIEDNFSKKFGPVGKNAQKRHRGPWAQGQGGQGQLPPEVVEKDDSIRCSKCNFVCIIHFKKSPSLQRRKEVMEEAHRQLVNHYKGQHDFDIELRVDDPDAFLQLIQGTEVYKCPKEGCKVGCKVVIFEGQTEFQAKRRARIGLRDHFCEAHIPLVPFNTGGTEVAMPTRMGTPPPSTSQQFNQYQNVIGTFERCESDTGPTGNFRQLEDPGNVPSNAIRLMVEDIGDDSEPMIIGVGDEFYQNLGDGDDSEDGDDDPLDPLAMADSDLDQDGVDVDGDQDGLELEVEEQEVEVDPSDLLTRDLEEFEPEFDLEVGKEGDSGHGPSELLDQVPPTLTLNEMAMSALSPMSTPQFGFGIGLGLDEYFRTGDEDQLGLGLGFGLEGVETGEQAMD